MVKSLGPLQRLQHVDELVALQLDLLDAIIERIDDVPPRKWWCQLSNSSVTKRCESLGETCPICNLFYE